MTYLAKDISVDTSIPVLLFQFVQGIATYNYTTAAKEISILSETWTPGALVPGNFVSNNDFPKDTLTIKLPLGLPFAQTFLGPVPESVTTITVWRAQVGETDSRVYWKGRIASTTITGEFMSIECEPVFSSLKRPSLRQAYTRSCRHVHYGSQCAIDATDFTSTGLTVTAIVGAVLTIPELPSLWDYRASHTIANGYFNGGTLTVPDGSLRTVIDHTGTSITLIRTLPSLEAALIATPAGVDVSISPGCDHTIEACEAKFNNRGNFGGPCFGAPNENPYTTSLEG